MSKTALITLIAILLYTGGFFGGAKPQPSGARVPSRQETAAETYGVIRANTVAVHEAPKSREVIAHLVRGDRVAILGEADGWYRVRLANGQIGYVNTFAVASSSPSSVRRTAGKFQVIGYYLTDSRLPSLPSLQQNLDVITTVIPWMWQVSPSGLAETDFNSREVAQALQLAGQHGIKSQALIHNVGATQAGAVNFSGSLIHQVLADPATRARTVEAIYRALVNWGLSGVHIDFEMVQPSDRQNLTQFVKELYERLHPAGFEVTIAVPAKTQESYVNSFSGAYDYAALARYVDAMMIMTYDEHWRGGPPGPVASIGWVERVIRYALSAGVPASKIILGVPAYGYDWPQSGRGRAVTYSQAIETASRHGVRVQWDDTAKVPYYRYGAGREVWFEDRSSLSHKLELVKKYGLAGISIWRLGQEDPGIWTVIREQLR